VVVGLFSSVAFASFVATASTTTSTDATSTDASTDAGTTATESIATDTTSFYTDTTATTVSASTDPTGTPGTTSLIVKLASGLSISEQDAVIARDGGTETKSISPLRLHVIEVAADDAAATLQNYKDDEQVASAEFDKTRAAGAEPDDTAYGQQWSLPRVGWDNLYGSVDALGLATVAVLDTGVDASHEDLQGQLADGTSVLDGSAGTTDPNGHGTEMAGIVAAATNNGTGVAGVGYAGVHVAVLALSRIHI
jgi:hypothetical protein